MIRKKQLLRLGFDCGASAIKCLASVADTSKALIIPPAIVQKHCQTLDSYRCQIGTDLAHRSFVGFDGTYFAVGELAIQLGATAALKPLKSETIVPKILAAVSIAAQRFDLGTRFDLQLGCLLPPGEFRDRDRLRQELASALADFDTPIGVTYVRLLRGDFYPEGMGVAQLLKIGNRRSLGIGVVLMAGHRNTSIFVTESHEILSMLTCDLGFDRWVRSVRAQTYDYNPLKLSAAIANYWADRDLKHLIPILRNATTALRQTESEKLARVIELSHDDYCNSLFDWLDENLPDRIDELLIAGGVGSVLQADLVEYAKTKLTPNARYRDSCAIFDSSVFDLPRLDVPDEYRSRMADVYCLWKYLMPELVKKSKIESRSVN
jgi:hypothetical protein